MDLLELLLPWSSLLRLDSFHTDGTEVIVSLTTVPLSTACPICGVMATRVHSSYTRTLADLPWAACRVQLQIQARKFFCNNPACQRHIFTERLPTLVMPWGRRTVRLARQQCQITLAVGGSAGARLSEKLGQASSRNTLLRLLRRLPQRVWPTPNVLGVDDFALRKGNTYGTILVDLEQSRPIALLPDREAETLERWLREHPGVEIIARDRAGAYALGAAAGAPDALQVADRFHLLRNLAEVLIKVFQIHPTALKSVTHEAIAPPPPLVDASLAAPIEQAEVGLSSLPCPTAIVLPPSASRVRRLARYEQVVELHRQGWTFSAIARQLGINRKTVSHYIQVGQFPERQGVPKRLDPYKPYLLQRWNAGCRTGTLLFEEIRQRGYQGQRTTLLAYITGLRQAQGLPPRSRALSGTEGKAIEDVKPLSPRQAAWRVLQRPDRQEEEDRQQLQRLCQVHEDFDTSVTLAQGFAQLLRHRQPQGLDDWLEKAASSTLEAFRRFAASLRRDYAAVKAALTLSWSSGAVEGHINRLKMIKRQMFGRADLDLLERRVVYTD